MLNSIEDIKLFIEWCKEHKIKSFKFKDLQFELSEIGFIDPDDYTDKLQSDLAQTNFEADQSKKEDEDLLFWSSQG